MEFLASLKNNFLKYLNLKENKDTSLSLDVQDTYIWRAVR